MPSNDQKVKSLLRSLIREVLDGFGNKNLGKDGVGGNLRYDVPLTGHTGGNINDDEASEQEDVKKAAIVLVFASDGTVLAVSRRNDPSAYGLPGGKVDSGEEPVDAATRELQEETGLIASDLKQIYSAVDSRGYETITFMGNVSGMIDTKEEGVIAWVKPEILVNGPFGDYNMNLFKRLGKV